MKVSDEIAATWVRWLHEGRRADARWLLDLLADREELLRAYETMKAHANGLEQDKAEYSRRIEKLERVVEIVRQWDRLHSLPDFLREDFREARRALDGEKA